ncbi:MAG: site-specific DNA-methyltransferase [Microthrixaceae bacterium]|nr:site-specific DNA-methyltransferase [Microthrixaceae bacterium]
MTVTPITAANSRRRGGPTATANFGSGRREAHDASAFYDRFVAPEISDDETVNPVGQLDVIHHGDARHMTGVASDSVALVVTSPPYFAGKQYEEELGVDGVPADYFEYLQLLTDVFSECKRVLQPGGRIAVNVANLGRRPYRSLSADVIEILQDLGLLLRGEVIWWKGRAAGGSCAWGTFQRPSNPVLRDVTERIIIASKGRFDRALTPRERALRGLPSTTTLSKEEFMEATTDMWEIAPESATRVGHPAPFPVTLPTRLIDLYTYADDVVLDPFMGSGTTAVAAVRTGRHFIGFDTDASYIDIAQGRIDAEREAGADRGTDEFRVAIEAAPVDKVDDANTGASGAVDARIHRAVAEGLQAKEIAEILLESCGFTNVRRAIKPRGLGITLDLVASDVNGVDWAFDVCGSFTSTRSGLRRSDALWKALGSAAVLHEGTADVPLRLILLTTDAPAKGSTGHKSLAVMQGPDRPVHDVIELLNGADHERLRRIALDDRGSSQ